MNLINGEPIPGPRNNFLLHFLRSLAGAVFVFSAVTKLIALDFFELYIFQQQIISFNWSAIAARLIISAECILGTLLLTNIYFRITRKVALLLLAVFSVFLLVQIIKGNSENCNCFGQLIRMTPLESLVKNGILIAILLFIKKETSFRVPQAASVGLFIIVFSLALPSVISPPDFMLHWSDTRGANLESSTQRIRENRALDTLHIQNGKHIVCFYSVTCQYCKRAAMKMDVIVKKYNLENDIVCVFAGEASRLPDFLEESNSSLYPNVFIPLHDFFRMAGPSVPVIFLSENGKLIKQYNYRSIDEKEIRAFFAQ